MNVSPAEGMEQYVVVLDAHCSVCGYESEHLNVTGDDGEIVPLSYPVQAWLVDFREMPKDCPHCGGVMLAAVDPGGWARREKP